MNNIIKKKRKFTSFSLDEALIFLKIKRLAIWELEFRMLPASSFFQEKMRRLDGFAVGNNESGKELLIDAVCEEIVTRHPNLRIWKQTPVQSDELLGITDYLIARRIDYLTKPALCVIEAKKDDFEQGAAQCLLAMKACQENNVKAGLPEKVWGVVSNGRFWNFYFMEEAGKAFQSQDFALVETEKLLGALDAVFEQCENYLQEITE